MNDTQTMEARSLWAEAWRRLKRNRLAMVCLGVIAFYLALVMLDFIPMWQTVGSGETAATKRITLIDWAFLRVVGPTDKDESYAPPGKGRHLMGTDIHGVDVLSKAVKGVRTAFILGGLTRRSSNCTLITSY